MTVSTSCYLIVGQRFTEHGTPYPSGKPSVRVSKGRPSLEAHEVAVHVNLQLPNSMFVKTVLQADVIVADGGTMPVIDTQVAANLAAAMEEQFGIQLNISAPE